MIDIAIIGAGPAGLSTALATHLYSRKRGNDLEVLVVDKDKRLGNKPCGGMVLWPAQCLLPEVTRLPGIFITGIRIVYRDIDKVIRFKEPVAKNIGREELSHLFMRYLDRIDIHVETGFLVRDVVMEKDSVRIRGSKEIRAKIVVGADGAVSLVRRKIFKTSLNLGDFGVAYQVWVDKDPETTDSINEFYYGKEYSPGGYSWVFPHINHFRVGVGYLMKYSKGVQPEYYIRKILKKNNMTQNKIIRRESFLVPLSGGVKKLVQRRAILVGDAAHQVAPLTGAGIHLAIRAGFLTGRILAESFNGNDFSIKNLLRYEKLWRRCSWELRAQRILIDYLLKKGSSTLQKGYEYFLRDFADVLVEKKRLYELVMKYLSTRLRKLL
ncbi:MAG: NAD(P)/FAD-dependent oxidoreductase [Candidatus Njordarchaeales archaeon]